MLFPVSELVFWSYRIISAVVAVAVTVNVAVRVVILGGPAP